MWRSRFAKCALLALVLGPLCLVICPTAHGQATGSFSGTVSDSTGSVIPGATVRVTAQQTGITRSAKTDATGHYTVPLLSVADYTVQVEFTGFQTAEQKNLRLQVDEHRELDFTLQPGKVTEKVDVTATPVAVETTNPTLGQVITSQQVAQLPLNGRDFVQLATLTPGTTAETNPNSFFNGGGSSEVSTRGAFSLSVGGSRVSSTDWLLDGNDNNELTAGGIAILPSIDAIQEFKVLTFNYSAQYGTRAGPTVLVTTKGGSNSFHGSVFEFLRNTDLDARSFFATEREKYNQNQFGGALGGPIKKDKTFFFVDYQGKILRQGRAFFGGFVPTAGMRAANPDFTGSAQLFNPYSTRTVNGSVVRDPFMCDASGNPMPVNNGIQANGTPCNIIPASLVNPIASQLINFYPLPNVSGNSAGNYANDPVHKLNENEFDARVDHTFSAKDTVFARFSYDQATVFLPGGAPGFAEQNTFSSSQNIENHGRNAAISETHIFSPTSINQISAGYNRIFNYIQSEGNNTCESQKLGIPGANLGGISCGLTSISMGGGFWDLGDRGFAPFQGGTNVFSISDSFDMVRGNHDIKVGGEVRANQMNVRTNSFQDGFFVFTNAWTNSVQQLGPGFFASGGDGGSNMADFLLGLPDLALHDQTFEGATTGRRWKLYRPFIQDDWRVSNNLTLNLGLAWAFVTPIREARNRQANFDFATGKFYIPGVTSDGAIGVRMDKTAFEPRIGFAYKLFGSSKTSLRGGYAIFHDSSWNQGAQGTWENPPFFAESNSSAFFPDLCPSVTAPCASTMTPTGKSISEGFPILTQPTDPSTFSGNLTSQNLNWKQGQVQQFNLNLERQLPGDVVLTAGYAGARSNHLLVDGINLNVASPTACGTVPGYTLGCGIASVPYPQFGTISNMNDIGHARYDALQFKAETKSSRHGLYALIGYTYARSFDTGLSDGVGTSTGATYYPLPNTSREDWALSQIQLNHSFTTSVIYDLPFGKGRRFGGDWNTPVNAVLGDWQVNVIEKLTSGFPLFMTASSNNSGVAFASNSNRPNQVCGGHLSNSSINEFFDTSCFVDAPGGELGNANRTPLYGPDFVNTDFSAIKHFPLSFHEGTDLEFRAEFFNLFNHAQFFAPGTDVDSSSFGQITQTVNNPRLIQFALKLTF
ncbi:MAG TPA: carboxypeptidase-like regulatory domain-containing protein [Terriglobales bacterium]|nr:carboxypeptidase-like regulatory domain-containing protein [Terriglobales bacterium]